MHTPRHVSFLAHFGLGSLGELPGIDELKSAGLLDLGPAAFGDALPPPPPCPEHQ